MLASTGFFLQQSYLDYKHHAQTAAGNLSLPLEYKPSNGWYRHLIQSAVMVSSFILFSLMLSRMLHRTWKKQDDLENSRKQAEDELRKLSRIAEQSPVAIVTTDLDGKIEYVNPRFVQVTGYTVDEVIGCNPSILKSGETAGVVYENLWQTILAGNVWEGNFCNKKKTGELFWEHSTISPLRNADGEITHFIAIKEDITNRIEVMDQLLHSQKMQSIGQLAGGVAHDFNNILSIINGYICLMQLETENDDPIREYIGFIRETSSRAAGLTHALLAFSRKQIIKPRIQNLNAVIANVSSLLERTLRDDIVNRVFFELDPLYVDVDSVQIDHVMINLATNAMDAMPDGGSLSIITSRRTMDRDFISSKKFGTPGDYAAIEITDSGIGMDTETVKQVFDPFFTTKAVGKGTGLGLSMALGIVKQHNGFIDVNSQPGQGTTFTIYLPLVPRNEAEDECFNLADMGTLPCGNETILLAEDEPNLRAIMQKLLKHCGYTVIVAEDGQAAVDAFRTCGQKIDLLFFDLFMPKKNGREAYMEIRSLCNDVKVLFSSGYPAEELHKMEHPDMEFEFLPKPVHPMTLMTRIRELLDK